MRQWLDASLDGWPSEVLPNPGAFPNLIFRRIVPPVGPALLDGYANRACSEIERKAMINTIPEGYCRVQLRPKDGSRFP